VIARSRSSHSGQTSRSATIPLVGLPASRWRSVSITRSAASRSRRPASGARASCRASAAEQPRSRHVRGCRSLPRKRTSRADACRRSGPSRSRCRASNSRARRESPRAQAGHERVLHDALDPGAALVLVEDWSRADRRRLERGSRARYGRKKAWMVDYLGAEAARAGTRFPIVRPLRLRLGRQHFGEELADSSASSPRPALLGET